jgi:hypothetical protein
MAKGKARIRGKRVGGLDRVSLMAQIFRVNQSRPCVVLMSSTTDFAHCVAMRGYVISQRRAHEVIRGTPSTQ